MVNAIDLDLVDINVEAMSLVSKELCNEYNIFPYDINSSEIHLVSFNKITDEDLFKLKFILKRKINVNLCEKEQYLSYMNKYYEEIYRKKIVEEFKSNTLKKAVDEEKKVSGPIISLVDSLLRDGICSGASDIHIEPWKDKVSVRFRIDGILKNFSNIPKNLYDSISTRVKVMGNMNITCKYISQDGEISMDVDNKYYNLRISTLPTIYGEKFVIRILERDAPLLNLKNLGFKDKDYFILKNILRFKQGLIIITGPTGSGKTTTLYSMINELNTESKNIVTVEKPVECEMAGVNQVAIGEQGNTYGSILRNVLRQDPDVIMVGEIIDRDTAEVAIRASLTGHLVLTTLHTNDASSAISRLTNMGIDADIIRSSLILVMAQRLTRLICKNCRTTYEFSRGERELLDMETIKEGHRGKGCAKCSNMGYKGRTIAYEIMTIGKELKENILSGDSDVLRNIAISQGMVAMDEYFKALVIDGYTTVEEYYSNMQIYNIEKALGVDYGI